MHGRAGGERMPFVLPPMPYPLLDWVYRRKEGHLTEEFPAADGNSQPVVPPGLPCSSGSRHWLYEVVAPQLTRRLSDAFDLVTSRT